MALLHRELKAFGIAGGDEHPHGIAFSAPLALVYRVVLWSRVANRVLISISKFNAHDGDTLHAGASEVLWREHLSADSTFAVSATGTNQGLRNTQFTALRVKDAIVDQFRTSLGRRPSVDVVSPDVRIHTHVSGGQIELSVDLAGVAMHRRGYRQAQGPAPLKENLAAAVLMVSGWPTSDHGFMDPMCGAGTLLIEAAWMAADVAPGRRRTHHGCVGWQQHDTLAWQALLDEALEREQAGLERLPSIVGFDNDKLAVAFANKDIEAAGLGGRVCVEAAALSAARPPTNRGVLVTNPPYGERMGNRHELTDLYQDLAKLIETNRGWTATVLSGDKAFARAMSLPTQNLQTVYNGRIECGIYRIGEGRQGRAPVRNDPHVHMFSNRVVKNLRQLSRWARKNMVSCYRIYDQDMPEYALAVDRYEDGDDVWLHVGLFDPPSSIDPIAAEIRAAGALEALPTLLEVPAARIICKQRRRQKGGSALDGTDGPKRLLKVREGDCLYWVELTQYLDTGLYLQDRDVRAWIRTQAKDKRVLNLFAYTGTATVQAAGGGASSSVSVDMSRPYVQWGEKNFILNKLDSKAHRYVQADCLAWLEENSDTFDLIYVAPPTFSNSKRMADDFDVRRDHSTLLRKCMARLSSKGVIVFLTHRQKFRLDLASLEGIVVTDLSSRTLPKDFSRHPDRHHCHMITRAPT